MDAARYTVRDNGDGTFTVTRNGSDVYTDTSLSFATRVRNAMNASLDERESAEEIELVDSAAVITGNNFDGVTQADVSVPEYGLAAPPVSAWPVWRVVLAWLAACAVAGFLSALLIVHWFGDLIANLLGGK